VTTDSIGCRDTVDNGKNGFLVPVKDSKTLAAKLKLLIDNKQLRETMGRNSRQKAEQQFSIDKVVEKHLETYDSLLT
jgi:glycosyltransferase involved in cell wall biosynthesis